LAAAITPSRSHLEFIRFRASAEVSLANGSFLCRHRCKFKFLDFGDVAEMKRAQIEEVNGDCSSFILVAEMACL
jgi:hypothetical protein